MKKKIFLDGPRATRSTIKKKKIVGLCWGSGDENGLALTKESWSQSQVTKTMTSFPSHKAFCSKRKVKFHVDVHVKYYLRFRVTMLRSRNFSTACLFLILCFIQFCLLDVSVAESPTPEGEFD